MCQNHVCTPFQFTSIHSWDLWMFIPLKMVLGIDPYPYHGKITGYELIMIHHDDDSCGIKIGVRCVKTMFVPLFSSHQSIAGIYGCSSP